MVPSGHTISLFLLSLYIYLSLSAQSLVLYLSMLRAVRTPSTNSKHWAIGDFLVSCEAFWKQAAIQGIYGIHIIGYSLPVLLEVKQIVLVHAFI